MHTAHNKDILKLSESATATMLRRPPDKSPPMDHRIMFSMIFKYCELINYIVLNARLEIIRGQRRMRSGGTGNVKAPGGNNTREIKNHT